MHNLHLLLNRLDDAGVEFVVVGGFAGVIHGSALITWELDICASITTENEAAMCRALADFRPEIQHPLGRQTAAQIQIGTEHGFLHVVSSVSGVGDFHRVRKQAIRVSMFGRTFAVTSIDDLVAAKEAVGRDKDLLAVKELRAIAAKRAEQQSAADEKFQ